MLKFMAGRLTEPEAGRPSWATSSAPSTAPPLCPRLLPPLWRTADEAKAGDCALRAAHEEAWRWHLGGSSSVEVTGEGDNAIDIGALQRSLDAPDEAERLAAAIRLGRAGHLAPLLSDLRTKAAEGRRTFLASADSWKEDDGQPTRPEGFFGRRWLVGSDHVGLAAGGRAAAKAVGKLLDSGTEPWWVRAAAAQTLAEMGKDAAEAAPNLRVALRDEEEWVGLAAAEALGCLAPSIDGANERALADAVLEPVARPVKWPFHANRFRGKWPLVALAKLAGQQGFSRLPSDAREAVVTALASEAGREGTSRVGDPVLRSGAGWWAELGLRRAAGAEQTSPGCWF